MNGHPLVRMRLLLVSVADLGRAVSAGRRPIPRPAEFALLAAFLLSVRLYLLSLV